MPYTPNPVNAAEPSDSEAVGTAAAEFRALKASINNLRTYLGATSIVPTTDLQGNSLATGDFYYNTAQYNFYVWDSVAVKWRTFQNTATSGTVTSASVTLDQNTPDILNVVMLNPTTIIDSLPAGANILLSIANPTNYAMTWPAGIKWVNGSVPTLLTYGVVFVNIFKNSTNLYGVAIGGAS